MGAGGREQSRVGSIGAATPALPVCHDEDVRVPSKGHGSWTQAVLLVSCPRFILRDP